MQTIQLNIQKQVRYKGDFEIKHNNFIQVINNHIIYEGNSIKDISYLDQSKIDAVSNMKHYGLYANYMLLEFFRDNKKLHRNMSFKTFKPAILSEMLNDIEDTYDAYKIVINRMISAFDHKYMYTDISNTDLIVKSISSGLPITATCRFSMNETSEGFENTLLVFGIMRDVNGDIVGVNAHDYAGNANSNYQNKNGESIVYHGDLFKKMFKDSIVGIPVEEDV